MAVLPRQLRLSRKRDIQAVFASGQKVADGMLQVRFCATDLPHPRLCIQVGRRISRLAVVRNRIRRRTREALNIPLRAMPRGIDLIVGARRPVATLPWAELTDRCVRLMDKVSRRVDATPTQTSPESAGARETSVTRPAKRPAP